MTVKTENKVDTRRYRETERKGRGWPVGPVLWLGGSKKLQCLAACGLAGDNGDMPYISKKYWIVASN